MSDALAGALCVLATMSAGPLPRSRMSWLAGAAVVVACLVNGGPSAIAPIVAAFVLAALAGLVSFRSGRVAFILPASTQASLVTLAFVAWLLPDALRLNGALAVLTGGAITALGCLALQRTPNSSRRRESVCRAPLHLAAAGACAALAYALGAQPGALAVVAVVAMVALIGAHLSLAIGGGAAAPAASLMSGAAASGLAIAAAHGGTNGALVVAAVALAIGCAQSSSFVSLARETP
ncbi:hypothetical protein [Caballeronia ptereochthonis]|jgi:hypothetical protein|uniref:Uncharacterized protein n=1 Tax=Caballeronia ptereochthonis TaxID=1777144 RepID=A0A158AUC8_9BURK|nr:hypothetical protein [Caballeronia ptereochthonis]SAK61343.1 hypothetical protein AWB83_02358 [Caballeronia ptereochthonis]